ncbi:MAG: glutathione peroxidase [Brumimicrobium sp.]|nr:glutathione peroxidase [Brumimicrobium sp.]
MKIYDFQAKDITGNAFDLGLLKNKKVMVVNTASECGLTPQYEQLEELYKNTDREKFEIIAFPCNDFGGQEPGSNEEVAEFCKKNYGVSFPLMSKISVKGEKKDKIYDWLLKESKSKGQHDEVKWNFHKFLINEEGDFVRSIEPTTAPVDNEIMDWING